MPNHGRVDSTNPQSFSPEGKDGAELLSHEARTGRKAITLSTGLRANTCIGRKANFSHVIGHEATEHSHEELFQSEELVAFVERKKFEQRKPMSSPSF